MLLQKILNCFNNEKQTYNNYVKKVAIFLISVFVFAVLLSGYKIFLVIYHPVKYQNQIKNYSEKYELTASLVASVINVESSYNSKAKSNKDAIGLMQIKLATANYLNEINNIEKIDETQLFKVDTNLEYGCMYLKYLLSKFDDTNTALCAYNAGETHVKNWLKNEEYSLDGKTLKIIPFEETKNYIKKINKNLKFYKKVFN